MTPVARRRGAARATLVAVCLLLSACRGSSAPVERAAAPTTTTTTTPSTTATTATTALPSSATAPTSTTAAPPTTGDPCRRPARADPDTERPYYGLQLSADPVTGRVTGIQDISFVPDLPVDVMVFRLWANGPRPASVGTTMTLDSVTRAGTELVVDLPDPTTAVIRLEEPVGAGTHVRLRLTWTLQVEGPVNDRISRQQGSLRLGSFVPLIAWQPGIGWATDPPTSGFAEATTSPTALWRYSVAVPDGFSVLASGLPLSDGSYVVPAARDIAVSVGRFTVLSATTRAPNPVVVTVGVHDGIDEANRYLGQIVGHLKQLAEWFGPYPWPSYSVAITPDLSGGIEFPMHVMQGPGTDDRTTPHEVAHMWFYGLVGNNQAQHPWLDEGLATYAEGRLLGTLDSFAARAIPSNGVGRAGEPMTYWESRASSYYRSVYVQTAAALAALGDVGRVDCALARYVADNAYTIAEPADLARALDSVFPDWRPVLAAAGLP